MKTKHARELVVRMVNEIGSLDRLAQTIADKGVNVLAVCAWVEGAQAVIRLVTDDNVRAGDVLRAQKLEPREAEVLVAEAPHKPGMLHRLTETLAKGNLDIHHLYATAAGAQDHSLIVFATANNDRALVLLNNAAGGS
jgi:hypothetical protein